MNRTDSLLALLDKARKDEQGLPPVHQWKPEYQADIDMRIARDGTWYYQESAIERDRMVALFSTILIREKDDFFLVTPVEKLRIKVDDAPFVAVAVERFKEQDEPALVFETNVGSHVVVGGKHPLWVETDPQTGEPSPYIHVRDNLNALIGRSAFYQLVDWAREQDGSLVIESGGETFTLGKLN